MKAVLILFLSLLILLSCRKQFGFGHPRDKAMKYYNEDFMLPDTSWLRVDGIYYYINEDENGKSDVNVFQFYKNGKVRSSSMVNSVLMISPSLCEYDEIRGYYKFDGDSLRFTEDAHYFKKVKELVGYNSGDTLYLKYKKNYFTKIDKGFIPYLFIQNGKILETGIDNKRYE